MQTLDLTSSLKSVITVQRSLSQNVHLGVYLSLIETVYAAFLQIPFSNARRERASKAEVI